MSESANPNPEPREDREEALRNMAELAIRAGEKLLAIASAARDVAVDPDLGTSPALERLRAALREAGILVLGASVVAQITN